MRKQRRRFNLLEEKVQQLQEQQSLSGGNQTTNVEKLMASLKHEGAAGDHEDYFGLILFPEEGEK